jgi:hypothetical protein
MRLLRSVVPLLAMPALLATLVLAAGCGSPGGGAYGPAATAIPKATATPKVAHAGQSAAQILAGFKAKGLPVGESVTYTDASDLNHLLGRPGQYTGKVNFKDTRTPDSGNHDVNIAVDDGGSIEVFATAADATKRFTYVQGIASSSALFAEYDYQDGLVVLRVSKILTPPQAQAYQTALQALP